MSELSTMPGLSTWTRPVGSPPPAAGHDTECDPARFIPHCSVPVPEPVRTATRCRD